MNNDLKTLKTSLKHSQDTHETYYWENSLVFNDIGEHLKLMVIFDNIWQYLKKYLPIKQYLTTSDKIENYLTLAGNIPQYPIILDDINNVGQYMIIIVRTI